MNRKQRRAESNHRKPLPPVAAADPDATFADAAFASALQHHRAGRLMDAEQLYRTIPAGAPGHADSLNFLGVIAFQTGRPELAATLLRRAIAANGTQASYHSHLGIALKQLGRLDEAIASYRTALALSPSFPEALNNLGATLAAQARSDEAIVCYRRAIALKPDYLDAHNNLRAALGAAPAGPPRTETSVARTFLHVGCGRAEKQHTTGAFAQTTWHEVRLDIDEAVKPDIIGTMTDMLAVADGSVDAVFSSHNIEHLYPHEVPVALAEFLRVLTPDGFAVITCPDLRSIGKLIADDKLTDPAYISPAGPIAPLDIMYGLRQQLAAGNLFMAHHCGFTERVLRETLIGCGFGAVTTCSHLTADPYCNLWALASKPVISETALAELASGHFPPAIATGGPVM